MKFFVSPKLGKLTIEEISLSLSPEEVFDCIHMEPFSFFLDSGTDKNKLGKYSFMGYSPFLTLKSKGEQIKIVNNEKIYHETGSPFRILNEIIKNFKLNTLPSHPPFVGGGVGYLAYDLCHFIEKLPRTAVDDLNLPDCYFCFYDTILSFDHQKKRWYISRCNMGNMDDQPTTDSIIERITNDKNKAFQGEKDTGLTPSSLPRHKESTPSLVSNFTKEDYLKAIKKAKEYIFAGDIYQVNLSQRFHIKPEVTPYQLYKKLRRINPAPFACYLNFQDLTIVSSSPERFLMLKGSEVQTRPIKGTRPRGKDRGEDIKLSRELMASEKDRAELNMIVDLERNDLGRVCDYGTIRVTEHATLETYPTVFHLVSTVEGKMLTGNNCIDLLKASFPGGSITGAPKVRSMEIIDELEPTIRNVYTGSIGYLGFNGRIDMNIAIRTIIIKNDDAYFQVGGGIVADSCPEDEYKETLDKAKALIAAFNPD